MNQSIFIAKFVSSVIIKIAEICIY